MTELSIMIIGVGSREMAPIPTFSLFGTGGTERQSGPFVLGRNVLSFFLGVYINVVLPQPISRILKNQELSLVLGIGKLLQNL